MALPGFHKFFKHASEEEREHAEKLMKYQNMRGGRIVLQDLKVYIVNESMNDLLSGLCGLVVLKVMAS